MLWLSWACSKKLCLLGTCVCPQCWQRFCYGRSVLAFVCWTQSSSCRIDIRIHLVLINYLTLYGHVVVSISNTVDYYHLGYGYFCLLSVCTSPTCSSNMLADDVHASMWNNDAKMRRLRLLRVNMILVSLTGECLQRRSRKQLHRLV